MVKDREESAISRTGNGCFLTCRFSVISKTLYFHICEFLLTIFAFLVGSLGIPLYVNLGSQSAQYHAPVLFGVDIGIDVLFYFYLALIGKNLRL